MKNLHDSYLCMGLGTDTADELYPPCYTKGPFLSFFSSAPHQALDTLISLISVVTDQWVEKENRFNNEAFGFEIEVGGKKKFWRGDKQVFLWAMDIANCPNVVATFLMALERWLYEKIDAEEDISVWIDQITKESDSIALLGILVSVAKYNPKLFREKLQFLLVLPHLIWWDQRSLQVSSQYVNKLAQEWFGMDHRKNSLEDWAIYFLLNCSDMKDFFATSRSCWEQNLGEQSDQHLELLICKFKPNQL